MIAELPWFGLSVWAKARQSSRCPGLNTDGRRFVALMIASEQANRRHELSGRLAFTLSVTAAERAA